MLKRLLQLGFIFCLSACSNPFSNRSAPVTQYNPGVRNLNCNEVQLNQGNFTPKQLRALTHCLNQQKEIQEIDSWVSSLTDEELSPWTDRLNTLLQNEPQFFYGLREIYFDQKKKGALDHLLQTTAERLRDGNNAEKIVEILSKHSKWIQSFLDQDNYKINTASIALLPTVNSFKRAIHEQWNTKNIHQLIKSVSKFHNASDSLTFQEIFKLFESTNLKLVQDSTGAERVSGFIQWLMTNGRIQKVLSAANVLSREKITCYDGRKSISDPLNSILGEVVTMSAAQAQEYFVKDSSALLILARSYCKVPTQLIPAHELLIESSKQETFSGFYEFIRPTFTDPSFSKLLASQAFADLSNDIQFSTNTHILQDIFTLAQWLTKNPIIEGTNKKSVAELIDEIFTEFSADELTLLVELAPRNEQTYQSLHEIISTLPQLTNKLHFKSNVNWISPLTKPTFANAVLGLIRLNDEKKLLPLFDRTIEIFKQLIDSGKKNYLARTMSPLMHSALTNSQHWNIRFWKNKSNTQTQKSQCENLPISWNYSVSSGDFNANEFTTNLDQLALCYNSSQTFKTLKDLANYLISKDPKGGALFKVNALQKEFFGFLFSLDSAQAFQSFNGIMALNEADLKKIKTLMLDGAAVLQTVKADLARSKEFKNLLSKYLKDKNTYSVIAGLIEKKQAEHAPNDLSAKKQALIHLTISQLPEVFNQFCPSKDTAHRNCQIEDSQVRAFLRSPNELAHQIVGEYLSTSQSWAHPEEFKNWKTTNKIPSDVATIEYHLNPMIKQFEDSPNVGSALFNFISRNNKSSYSVEQFLREKSFATQLIPYIYQNPNYPQNSDQEFHQRIRIRLINDLQRLELLAINADFRPFGLMKNFGMNFIKEIALAKNATELSSARNDIINEYNRFNLNIIDRLGNCDSRGKRLFGRWLSGYFCRGELGDIRARMFNLSYMLSVLDDDRALALLRDLFYSLYESNSEDQLNVYSNGVNEPTACLSSARSNAFCKRDLLELIPKAARLGLLHQIAMSSLNENTNAVNAVIQILKKSVRDKKDNEISAFLATPSGAEFIRETVGLGLELSSTELIQLGKITESVSKITNQEWLSFSLKLIKKHPHLIALHSKTLQALIQESPFELFEPNFTDLLSQISIDLNNDTLLTEVAQLIQRSIPAQKNMLNLIKLDFSGDQTLPWLRLLAKNDNQAFRNKLADGIRSNSLDDFCDVFSDAKTSLLAYNFLENGNQSSGVRELLDHCERFLR